MQMASSKLCGRATSNLQPRTPEPKAGNRGVQATSCLTLGSLRGPPTPATQTPCTAAAASTMTPPRRCPWSCRPSTSTPAQWAATARKQGALLRLPCSRAAQAPYRRLRRTGACIKCPISAAAQGGMEELLQNGDGKESCILQPRSLQQLAGSVAW